MDENNTALIAARRSWACVMAGDKDGWLALMAMQTATAMLKLLGIPTTLWHG